MLPQITFLVFGFSHLLQVTSDLGSNPGCSSWHVAFDVRGVRGVLMPVCGLQRVSHKLALKHL